MILQSFEQFHNCKPGFLVLVEQASCYRIDSLVVIGEM